MPQAARPLSPHLGIYRWPLAMALSIVHRATGIALAVGTLMLIALFVALAAGPQSYEAVRHFCGSPFGLFLLFGWSWSLAFHLANGIRHLFWDGGAGFSIAQARNSGIVVILASLVLTALVWLCVFARGGAA